MSTPAEPNASFSSFGSDESNGFGGAVVTEGGPGVAWNVPIDEPFAVAGVPNRT